MGICYWFLFFVGIFLIIELLKKQRICPKCKKPLPRFRIPTSLKQLAFGGWTCQHCGVELNRVGGVLKVSNIKKH